MNRYLLEAPFFAPSSAVRNTAGAFDFNSSTENIFLVFFNLIMQIYNKKV
jgi:hypothetical protein